MGYMLQGLQGCNCEHGITDGTGRPAGLGCACNDKPLAPGQPLGLGVTIPNTLLFGPAGFLYDSINELSNLVSQTTAPAPAPETIAPIDQAAAGFDLSSLPWVWIAAGGLAIWFISGTTQKRRARRRIYNDYKRRLDEADEEYSTKGRIKRGTKRLKKIRPRVTFG
jgi:hypothetical protein